MKPSLPLLPLLLAIILLSGCPDSKMPKVPPQVPEPKAVSASPMKIMNIAHLNSPVAAGLRRPT